VTQDAPADQVFAFDYDHSGKLDSSTISCSTGLGPDSSKSPVFVKRNRDPQRTTGARRPEPCRVRRTRNSSEGQDKQARSLRPESAACQVFIRFTSNPFTTGRAGAIPLRRAGGVCPLLRRAVGAPLRAIDHRSVLVPSQWSFGEDDSLFTAPSRTDMAHALRIRDAACTLSERSRSGKRS